MNNKITILFLCTLFQHFLYGASQLAENLFDSEFYSRKYSVPISSSYLHYLEVGDSLGNMPNHWFKKNEYLSEDQINHRENSLICYAKFTLEKIDKSLTFKYDFFIAGSGFAGATSARLLADKGYKVLIVEKRPYLGGNAHDCYDENGILIHLYGPHIFHTNNKLVFEFLSRFTDWRFYEHRVKAFVDGKLYPMPINRTTVNQLYGLNLQSDDECEAYYASVREKRESICNSEDVVLSLVGKDLCDKFFRNYTAKQWGGLDLKDLSPDVLRRIPTRTNQDDRYFADIYQMMPLLGYTQMFKRMLDHPNITTLTGVDFLSLSGSVIADKVIFTGPIDSFFQYKFGPLSYRSLGFSFEFKPIEGAYQEVGTVNYPNDFEYTRITEFKHLTGQKIHGTTILKEYPKQAEVQEGDEPFYPILSTANQVTLDRYKELALMYPNLILIGRLAEYKYYNMDQVVAVAMEKFKDVKEKDLLGDV